MITIENSHKGNTTYIVGHYFVNGSICAPLSDLDEVYATQGISDDEKERITTTLENDPYAWGSYEHWYDLIIHEDWRVRRAVARQGHFLDKLVNDKDCDVRTAVAKQGYGLDKLVNDENFMVRVAVASQQHALDVLVNDPAPWVRVEVASQGYGLGKLIHDTSASVRKEVAKQGYGLDMLINDPSTQVRKVANKMLEKQQDTETFTSNNQVTSDGGSTSYYTIPEWATELRHLMEHKNMTPDQANIFKAAYRLGEKSGTSVEYDLNKIIFFANCIKERIKREEGE